MKISGIIFLITAFYNIFGSFVAPTVQINALVLLLDGMVSVAMVYGVFKLLHLSIYFKKPLPVIVKFFAIWILSMILICLFILIQLYAPKQWVLKIGSPFDWMAILMILISATVYVLLKKERDFSRDLTFIIIFGIFGLLMRTPPTKEFFQNGKIQCLSVWPLLCLWCFLD